MTLNFNMKVNLTDSVFITPRILAESKSAKNAKELPASLALKAGYIIKAISDSNALAFTDKTKSGAGADLSAIVTSLPADTMYNLYMPITIDDRESESLEKWQLCVTIKQADMITACKTLASVNAIMVKAEADSLVIANGAKYEKYTANQPVYFTSPTTGKGKSRGKVTTFTL